MFKKISIVASLLMVTYGSIAQTNLKKGTWRAAIAREDGTPIVFNLDVEQQKGKTVFYVVNGEERMLVNDVKRDKDSLFVSMPVFESSFKLKIISTDSLAGTWIKRGAVKDVALPFSASAKQKYRFTAENGDATTQAGGKWKIDFIDGDKHSPAIGNFIQKGNTVTGSILTPSGDYRFLAGIVTGNLLKLSTFDGVHAMVFTATIDGDKITDGTSFSGKSYTQKWTGNKDANAALPSEKLTRVKDGESGKLDFTFEDLDGKQVSINDARFKDKVVIIQLMGSWCPNCMDETAFMSEFYKKNKQRGVEMIGLAYEYTTDVERSKASLRKFQKRFDVKYPILLSSATVGDPQRTEKTLPQLTDIKVFPTTLILGKDGKVAEITTDFFGPGTGDYYTAFKEDFEKKIDNLLK